MLATNKRSVNAINEEIVPPFEWFEDSATHWLVLQVPGFRREEVKLEVNTDGLIRIGGERKIGEIKYVWFEQVFKAPQNSRPEDSRVGLKDEVFYVIIPKQASTHIHAVEKITAATPGKTPLDDEDSYHEMGKKVNNSGGDYSLKKNEEIPDGTPVKSPKDVEDSSYGKGKNVNDHGEYPNKNEGTIEKIPTATPVKSPKDEEDSSYVKGKMVNDHGDYYPTKNEGTTEEEQIHGAKECNFLAQVANKVKQNKGILLTAILAFSLGVLVSHNNLKKTNSKEKLLIKFDSQNHNNIQSVIEN